MEHMHHEAALIGPRDNQRAAETLLPPPRTVACCRQRCHSGSLAAIRTLAATGSHPSHVRRQRSVWKRLVRNGSSWPALAIIALSVVAYGLISVTADASHLDPPSIDFNDPRATHVGTVHGVLRKEDFCVDDTQSELTFDQWKQKVNFTLNIDDPAADGAGNYRWDSVADGYVDFNLGAPNLPCSSIDLTPFEAMYWVWGNANDTGYGNYPCSLYTSCVVRGPRYFNYNGSPYNHWDSVYDQANFRYDHVHGAGNLQRRRFINHESGHLVGLADGIGCPETIMHECGTTYSWPRLPDINSVRNNVVPTASQP